MALGTPTPTLIHQGPGWIYLNVCAPASGKRHLIGPDGTPLQPAWAAGQAVLAGQMIVDSNGNVQECTTGGTTFTSVPASWGNAIGTTTSDGAIVVWTCAALAPAYLFAGALEGSTDLDIGAKIEETIADQETLPIDAVMTGEVDSIAVTLKESDCTKLQLLIPHGTYAAGTKVCLTTRAASGYYFVSWSGATLDASWPSVPSSRSSHLKKPSPTHCGWYLKCWPPMAPPRWPPSAALLWR